MGQRKEGTHPRQKAMNPEYMKKRANAVKEYMTTNKSLRQVEKETGINYSVIYEQARKDIANNSNTYEDTLMVNRANIRKISARVRKDLDKIGEINSIDELVKLQDIALKAQKLINLIEGVNIGDAQNMPNSVNIQINNYDTKPKDAGNSFNCDVSDENI